MIGWEFNSGGNNGWRWISVGMIYIYDGDGKKEIVVKLWKCWLWIMIVVVVWEIGGENNLRGVWDEFWGK